MEGQPDDIGDEPRKQLGYPHQYGYLISAFPIERKGRLLHNTFNFWANYPVHFISAYYLPVYALQRTLP